MTATLMIAALGIAAVALPPGHAAEKPFSAVPEFEGLTERWTQGAADLGVPGFSVAFVRDGKIEAIEGFGIRDEGGAGAVDADTMFYIASCTKTYVGSAILALADDGKIDLDAPVKTYLPRFTLADASLASSITVRDLLSHKPGINSFPIVFLDAYTGEITEDRYYHWLSQITPMMEVEYTNVHFTLLGRIVEAVSGMSWRDYLDQRVLEPAGMHRTTGYASEMYGDANAAFPMESADGGFARVAQIKSDAVMHAAGGMGTSAHDGGRWLLLNLNNGEIDGNRVLSESIMEEMHTRQSALAEPEGQIRQLEGFGLAWQFGNYRQMTTYLTHGGGYIGTAAHLSFMPEKGWGVVVLANASPSGQALCDVVSIDIYDRLLGVEDATDLLPRYVERIQQAQARRAASAGQSAPPLRADSLTLGGAAYAGTFSNAHWGDLTLRWGEDGLIGGIGQLGVTLRPGEAPDQVVLASTAGQEANATFEIVDGRVVAITLDMDEAGLARFERAN